MALSTSSGFVVSTKLVSIPNLLSKWSPLLKRLTAAIVAPSPDGNTKAYLPLTSAAKHFSSTFLIGLLIRL